MPTIKHRTLDTIKTDEDLQMYVDVHIEELQMQLSTLTQENERLRGALIKLRDCDWVISLPDRMDAVRDIAKQALAGDKKLANCYACNGSGYYNAKGSPKCKSCDGKGKVQARG